MKIAIITFSCAFNYGAVLQTYGLYSYLKGKGNEVSVIDYIPERYNLDAMDYTNKALKRTRLWKYIPFSKAIWKRTRLVQMKRNRANFRIFLENNIRFTHKYFTLEELKEDIPEADVYITGSDQVWNPDFVWNGDIDKPYYLAFLPDSANRISYSSSFGKNKLEEHESLSAEVYLKKYKKLSVREKSGVKILDGMGLKAIETADPVILAGVNVFKKLINKDKRIKKSYLLLFQINFNKELFEICRILALKNKVDLIVLIPDVQQASKCKYNGKVVIPNVEEWLTYFMYSSYIVTDSFHATVFSIMFEKPFSSCTLSGYNGRIYNILNKTGLIERILPEPDLSCLEEQFKKEIPYNIVREKMELWQEESRNWLDNVLFELI